MKTIAESPKIEYDIGKIFTRFVSLEKRFVELEKTNTKKDEIITKQAEIIDKQSETISKQVALIEYYERQLKILKRRQFGASSEVTGSDFRQLNLLGEVIVPPPPPEVEEVTIKRKKRAGKRAEDLASLPVIRTDFELPEDERNCPKCDNPMQDIGVSVRKKIEIIPAQAILKEEAIHSYKCVNDNCTEQEGKQTIVTADAPKPLISGSLASPSLVAHIAYQKYSNGMPLYRLENGFKHDGVNISRQNMASWVIKCVQLYLMVIYSKMTEYLLSEKYLHADETTVQVLHELNRRAQTKSYEWIYRTSGGAKQKIVIYIYKETREWKHPQEFLKTFKGFLHADGYEGYHNLHDGIIVVGCWSHARREWENIWKTIPESKREGADAETGLQYINALFKLEREFTKQKLTPEQRYKARLEKSKPISDAYFLWVENLGALPKSPLGKAAGYSLNQRKYLENVFLDGNLELSNNRCERSVKPFVMGRKAWLFSNTPDGAEASSVMYSIIETAKENGLHPFHYMKFLLETLPNMNTSGSIDELLPWSGSLPDWCHSNTKPNHDVWEHTL